MNDSYCFFTGSLVSHSGSNNACRPKTTTRLAYSQWVKFWSNLHINNPGTIIKGGGIFKVNVILNLMLKKSKTKFENYRGRYENRSRSNQ